jgi:hypothetical protein
MLIFYRNVFARAFVTFHPIFLLSVIFEAEKLYSVKSDWCSFPRWNLSFNKAEKQNVEDNHRCLFSTIMFLLSLMMRLNKLEHLSHFIHFCVLSVLFEAEKFYSVKNDRCLFPSWNLSFNNKKMKHRG